VRQLLCELRVIRNRGSETGRWVWLGEGSRCACGLLGKPPALPSPGRCPEVGTGQWGCPGCRDPGTSGHPQRRGHFCSCDSSAWCEGAFELLRPLKGSTRKAWNVAPLSQFLDHRLVHLLGLGPSVSGEERNAGGGPVVKASLRSFLKGCGLGCFPLGVAEEKKSVLPSPRGPSEAPVSPVSAGLWGSRSGPAVALLLWGRSGENGPWPKEKAEMSAGVGRSVLAGGAGPALPLPAGRERELGRVRQAYELRQNALSLFWQICPRTWRCDEPRRPLCCSPCGCCSGWGLAMGTFPHSCCF